METIQEVYKQSTLSFAAYADLTAGVSNSAFIAALQNQAKMSASQAADFASKWQVVDQFSGTLGLSATVFQEISSGTRYLAIRGTESLGDLGANYILVNGFPSELNPQFSSLRDQINLWTASGALPASFTVKATPLAAILPMPLPCK